MKKVTIYFLAVLAAAGLLVLSGCTERRTWRIGVSQCSSDDWRRKMNEEILRQALILGDSVEVEIRSADDSNERQIADLRYFADAGFDLIAVAPNEAEALTPVVSELRARGIPVIVFDRSINTDDYTAFQGADNEAIGRMAAEMARSYYPSGGRVLEIGGLPGSTPARHRSEGFHAGVADSPELTIVASAPADWNFEKAVIVTDSALRHHPDINVVYAHNDRMAMGAAHVLDSLGIRHRVKVIGIDAAPAIGLRAVADGVIDASFVYPTEGGRLMETAMAILTHQPYDTVALLPTLSPIVGSNAPLFLLQEDAIRAETAKIATLKTRIDEYMHIHTLQRTLLTGAAVIVLLAAVVIFLMLRAYWANQRHRNELAARAETLRSQRDELDTLYHRLEEATGSKLTFFTNVSHDLRTPLTLIAEPVHQMAEATNLTERQHTLMQLADKNVKRLQRLVNQILDIRKFDGGHLALNLENVDLAEALRQWVAPFAEAAARRHLRFFTDISGDGDCITAVDVEKIERVLFNLISNAFKFTPANGTVSVALARQGDTLVLTVADTGQGIPTDQLPQVFDRFFHSASGDINPNGSGIGLALSKTFVTMHGGNIAVESEAGKGSKFTVTLPVRRVEAAQATSHVEASVEAARADVAELDPSSDPLPEVTADGPTLLVVDDNPDICTLVKAVFADRYAVIAAQSGAQAIRLATKYIPDLIVCDVMMPGIDGYETCRRLKAEPVTSHIPVLLLTACTHEEQRTHGYECGADGYMSKPFDSEMLRARCHSLIENRKRILGGKATQPAGQPAPALPLNDIDDEFYGRFMAIIEKNLANSELSVEEIAGELGLSRVQMYRKIKALTNYSPAEIMRNTRLEHAARMLKTTRRTVSEVAYACGFSAPGYFAKCYKEYFKESPTDTQSRTSKASDN